MLFLFYKNVLQRSEYIFDIYQHVFHTEILLEV